MGIDTDRKLFISPPAENRPAPFWFWNDHLDSERLIEQFDALVAGGTGGAVIHARGGLDGSEYLDESWFDAVTAVVEHAAETKAITWLYDELGWPSGSAGGRNTSEHPEIRAMRIQMHDVTPESTEDIATLPESVVGAYVVTHTDPEHGIFYRKDRGAKIKGAVTLLPDRIEFERIDWPSKDDNLVGKRILLFEAKRDGGSIDYLDERAAAIFLESTHEQYYKRYAEHFGTTITHIFMDEAGMFTADSSLPWRENFEGIFRERRGYDLVDRLPALFFEVEGHEKDRYAYWSLATELFREGFGKPLHEWCSAHNIHYSGHYVFETTLKEATRQLGSTMPLYEYQGMPGIDVLGGDSYSRRFSPEDFGFYTVMVKQAASVVHQLDKPGLMSESYGVAGHATGPQEMQTATNWQMALGVTFIAQHAPFYSMRGNRKLDHPPIIGWQQPYWPFVNKHMDATSRTGWLLSQGKHRSNVLLLHPQASMQATYRQFRTSDEYKAENYIFDADMPFELIDKHFTKLSVELLDAQIDFDYGDEEIMARYASVVDARLRVGEMAYDIVALPPMVNIRSTTLDLLRQYAANGGTIIVVGSTPHLVDGDPSNEARRFLHDSGRSVTDGPDHFDYSNVVKALTDLDGRTVTLTDSNGKDVRQLKVHRRIWDDREIIYVANVSQDHVRARLTCEINVDGILEEWDLSSGKTSPLTKVSDKTALTMDLEWYPRQARAFVAMPGTAEVSAPASWTEIDRIAPEWVGHRTAQNVLPLDACRLPASDTMLSISEAQALLDECDANASSAPVAFAYPFDVETDISALGEISLAAELGESPRISVNDESIPTDVTGWLFDPTNQTLLLDKLVQGHNELLIEDVYTEQGALQSPWIVGDFDVQTADSIGFCIVAESGTVEIGSWPDLGMPFYAGTVKYRSEVILKQPITGIRVILDMPGLAGSAQIRVNSTVVDHVLWPPYSCDITEFVKKGTNVIEIEVANTLRNLYGAHYNYDEKIQAGISIASYSAPYGATKQFMAYGMLSAPEIVIERS
jgi:hypothetical protein